MMIYCYLRRHLDILAKGGKIDPDQVMAARTIREFDDACTRKMFNYTTVNNYYRDASSCRFIEHVKVPLLCMNALDDPIAAAECIPYDEIKINPNVVLATTDTGGHIGWFEHNRNPTRWMVKPLTEFIVAMFQVKFVFFFLFLWKSEAKNLIIVTTDPKIDRHMTFEKCRVKKWMQKLLILQSIKYKVKLLQTRLPKNFF